MRRDQILARPPKCEYSAADLQPIRPDDADMSSSPFLRLALVALLVTIGSCVRPLPDPERVPPRPGPARDLPPLTPPPTPTIRIAGSDGASVELPLDRYVTGAVLAEAALYGLDAATMRRVAEVQAIIVRTYALANHDRHASDGYALCSTTHCQVYRPPSEYPPELVALVAEAVHDTSGQILTHDGGPINAVYHAHCGGHTSDASVPWGGSSPVYLQGVTDPFCQRDAPSTWQLELSRAALQDALGQDTRTALRQPLDDVVVSARDRAGRARSVRLSDRRGRVREVRGEVFRAALSAALGARALQSTRFTVRRAGDRFVFEGQGFGHGVGLCQHGAMARAKRGHPPSAILTHYYPNATLGRHPQYH